MLTKQEVIEIDNPYQKIIPCVLVQTPFDSSIKGLLFEILRVVDEKIGSKYYANAIRAHSSTDMLIGAVSQVALCHIGLLVVDEIQHVVNHKNGRTLIGCLTQLINNTGISICMVGTPESAAFFTQAMQLARRALGLQYNAMDYNDEFKNLCNILYQFQYVKKRTELDTATIQWLYEHSQGNISTVVGLIHDAQEIGILEGFEVLNLETLRIAYDNRMKMLHSYIKPKKKSQTSNVRQDPFGPLPEQEIESEFSIVNLAQRAKNECIDAVAFLQEYLTVEEVAV